MKAAHEGAARDGGSKVISTFGRLPPQMQITELLARRTDLSTFLVHLTRSTKDGRTAKQNLLNIIKTNLLEARSPFGAAVQALEEVELSTESQRCVCFTETPLEHV